jgi:hypothetical protein
MKKVVWQVRLEHRYNEDYIVNEGFMEEDNLSINIFYNDEDILSTFALKITNLIIITACRLNFAPAKKWLIFKFSAKIMLTVSAACNWLIACFSTHLSAIIFRQLISS